MNITNIKDHEKKEIVSEDNFLYKFLNSCLSDKLTISEFEKLFEQLKEKYPDSEHVGGKSNNAGTINVSIDAASSLFERITNAIDANLEYRYETDNSDQKNNIEALHENYILSFVHEGTQLKDLEIRPNTRSYSDGSYILIIDIIKMNLIEVRQHPFDDIVERISPVFS